MNIRIEAENGVVHARSTVKAVQGMIESSLDFRSIWSHKASPTD